MLRQVLSHVVIKDNPFKAYVEDVYSEQLKDIVDHGAYSVVNPLYGGLKSVRDLYKKYEPEIWEILTSFSHQTDKSVLELLFHESWNDVKSAKELEELLLHTAVDVIAKKKIWG